MEELMSVSVLARDIPNFYLWLYIRYTLFKDEDFNVQILPRLSGPES